MAAQGNIRAQKTAWKWDLRKQVWNHLEDNDLADFPRPVHHRIPNFKGAAQAGERLAELPEFTEAKVVKVNPDTPQKSVRVATLRSEKSQDCKVNAKQRFMSYGNHNRSCEFHVYTLL